MLIYYARIIASLFFSCFILIFSSCDLVDENIKTIKDSRVIDRNKTIPPPEKEIAYNDCTDYLIGTSTPACDEPHCNCPGGYSREDLDPCDYSNMGDYGLAVVCELNRVSTNCSAPGLPYGCTEMELCIKALDVPGDYLQNHPLTTPWKYCDEADDCETWTCTGGIFDIGIHIYLSVDDQDILVAYAWDMAYNNAPICDGTSNPAEPYAVYFKICDNANYRLRCFDESSLCANKDIRLHVLYKCCD